jgi:hypothetical protein
VGGCFWSVAFGGVWGNDSFALVAKGSDFWDVDRCFFICQPHLEIMQDQESCAFLEAKNRLKRE